jgi:hypothetical protein
MASQFLGIQYSYYPFNFGLRFRLLFPYAVLALLVGPANQIRGNRVWHPAG